LTQDQRGVVGACRGGVYSPATGGGVYSPATKIGDRIFTWRYEGNLQTMPGLCFRVGHLLHGGFIDLSRGSNRS